MALTGNIEVFPLQEVLRLLARSGKDGCLRIEAGGDQGRIYLVDGALTLATTSTDREILDQIVAAGIVDRSRISDTGDIVLPEVLAPSRQVSDLTDFVREHVVESLYRIRRPRSGSFEFLVDAASRFRTGQTFDAEVAVGEADRRAAEWAEIERTIDDLHRHVQMVSELPDSEVTVNSATWRVLSSLKGGASIADIAARLGLTEFRCAREVAGLMRAGLLEPVPFGTPAPSTGWADLPPVTQVEAPVELEEPLTADEPETPWESLPASQPVEAEADWRAFPWGDAPVVDETPEDGAGFDDSDEEAEEEPATGRDGGWWAEAMGEPAHRDDTDTFLESVFSELGESEKASPEASEDEVDEEETGFSMGLLRRRRMGPMAKDITD